MGSGSVQNQTAAALIEVSDEVILAFPDFEESLTPWCTHGDAAADLSLSYQQGVGLTLQWHKTGEKKPLHYHLDYVPNIAGLRSFPAPKQGAFNQALGKKTQCVLDATGGWGGDALLMATQGYKVTILERNPVMAIMLHDAFNRLANYASGLSIDVQVPSVKYGDSIALISEFSGQHDCVYLDPMFPQKRKKSAAVNKQMQLLQWMVGADIDAAQLVSTALSSGVKRVAVKRPDYAEPLYKQPSQQFSSKLVHYDVYVQ